MITKRRIATSKIRCVRTKASPIKNSGVISMRPIEEYRKMLPNEGIKALIQDSMKDKGITPEEAIRSIGLRRYAKKTKSYSRY